MLLDQHNRRIDYLRVSVTDRCNLRCIYCMPESGILQKEPQEILTFEEIARIVEMSVALGINKIKVTGGEPLVRRNLTELLELLSSIEGLKDLSLTTNGALLKNHCRGLKKAGLGRLNISIDTLESRKFRYITKTENLEDVLEGIDAAISEGFFIKLNVVIMKGLNDNEILDFARFAKSRGIIARFIELMPMVNNGKFNRELYVSCNEIKERLAALGSLKPQASRGLGSGPAEYYEIEEEGVTVGFISPISCKFCLKCNRLRLTSDGVVMPCLAGSEGFNLKRPLREGRHEEALNLIRKAVSLKPQGHDLTADSLKQYFMSQIGG